MIDVYVAGVVVAVVIGLVKVFISTAILFSLRTRNMKLIGLHLNCMHGAYTTDTPSQWQFLAYVGYLIALAPLGSWISVASATWQLLRSRFSNAPASDDLKRLQYRLAHVAMTRDQMVEWQEEMAKTLGLVGPVRTGNEGDRDLLVLVLEPVEWNRKVRMSPDKHIMKFYGSHDVSSFHSTFEYRFEGNEVLARMLDSHSDHCGEKEWQVQDGAVLETEIRRRAEKNRFFAGSVESDIAQYYAEVAWHPVRDARVRFFAMMMHPTEFAHRQIVALVRAEIQRAKTAVERASVEASQLKFEVLEKDGGIEIHFPSQWTEDERHAASETLGDLLKKLGTTYHELGGFGKTRAELLRLVGEDSAP